jgi:hypothetical protein
MTHSLDGQGLLRRKLAGASLLLLAGCGGGNTEKDEPAVAPTLTIGSDTPGDATGPFTVRFTFSAAVSNFATNRILITNGFLNGAVLVKLSDTVYTLRVTPTSNKQEVLTVEVLAGAFKDATGTASSLVAYRFGQRIDTVVVSNEPVLTISNNTNGNFATGPVTFTFDFSLDVGDSFSIDDIEPDAGTLSNFTKVSATRYTVLLTLPAATSGLLKLTVGAGAFQSTASVPSQQDYTTAVLFVIPA